MAGMDTSSIQQEIQQILNNGANPVHFDWGAVIEANGKKIVVQKITSIDIMRNFEGNYADQIMVKFHIPMGTYLNQIFPYKDNLLCTLTKVPVAETGGSIAAGSGSGSTTGSTISAASSTSTTSTTSSAQTTQDIENHKMRATIVFPKDEVMEGNHPANQNLWAMDMLSMKEVDFQLVDLALEQIRMQSVGSVIRKTTPGDAIKFFMTAISQNVQIDGKTSIKGVDMVAPDNNNVRDHIVLNHGLRFSDVPGWIHQHMGGVYNGGLGFYLQGGIWYVYPLYTFDRFQNTPKNLTLINIPKNQMPGSDRTYRKTNNQLIVLLTGENKHIDNTDHAQLNQGNGLRFTDASKIMEGFGVAKDNKYTIDRQSNNTEFVASPRSTGLNNVQMSERRITSNNFYENGKMANRMGQRFVTTWENSDPGSLYPGMPVQYIYYANGNVQTVYGELLQAHSHIAMTGKGMVGGRYVCNTALLLFLDNGSGVSDSNPNATNNPTLPTTT
jgi:hypothetical protein